MQPKITLTLKSKLSQAYKSGHFGRAGGFIKVHCLGRRAVPLGTASQNLGRLYINNEAFGKITSLFQLLFQISQ